VTFALGLNSLRSPRLIESMDNFTCPICKAERPEEHHLDWCTYEGPEPDEQE
jgi:hypothetical protein